MKRQLEIASQMLSLSISPLFHQPREDQWTTKLCPWRMIDTSAEDLGDSGDCAMSVLISIHLFHSCGLKFSMLLWSLRRVGGVFCPNDEYIQQWFHQHVWRTYNVQNILHGYSFYLTFTIILETWNSAWCTFNGLGNASSWNNSQWVVLFCFVLFFPVWYSD